MLRLYGAYKDEGNLAVDVSFLIDPEGFVVDVCNFLVGKPLIFAALTFEYTVVPGEHGGLGNWQGGQSSSIVSGVSSRFSKNYARSAISSNGSFASAGSADFAHPVNKSSRAAPLSPKNSEAGSNNNIRPCCAKIQLNLLCTFMDMLFCTKSLAVQEYTRRPSRRLLLSETSSSSPRCGHRGDASPS